MKIVKFTFLLLLSVGITEVSAQRITGYFPNYNYTASNYLNIQWDKMTHLYYFSLNPKPYPTLASTTQSDGSLWFNDTYSWFTTTYFNNVVAQARSVNPDIKIFIVSGGASGSDADLYTRFNYIASNASRRNTFCNNILNFIKTNNLDGWDLDWEFPDNATARNNHEALLSTMRQKMDSMMLADCKHYEISIAVGGGFTDVIPKVCWNPAHTDYVNANVINYVDYVNIMTYDGDIGSAPCSFSSHQHYNLVVKALSDWSTDFPTWPKSKMQIGVGFYDNPIPAPAAIFSSGGNNSTWYNQTYWGDGGGSGCPNMQSKVDYARTQGTAGIFIWELTQDNLCSGTTPACYSLLDCIYQRTISTWGTWTAPADPCTMPVVLTQFTGENHGSSTYLSWQTSEEKDHDYFVVQRSEDGEAFTDVALIESGEANQYGASYNYKDYTNASYYRLKIVSVSGKEEYSRIVSIKKSAYDSFSPYPNPFEETLTLNFPETETAEVKVFNNSGQEIFSQKNISGQLTIGQEWTKGLYFIHVISGSKFFVYKVVKK